MSDPNTAHDAGDGQSSPSISDQGILGSALRSFHRMTRRSALSTLIRGGFAAMTMLAFRRSPQAGAVADAALSTPSTSYAAPTAPARVTSMLLAPTPLPMLPELISAPVDLEAARDEALGAMLSTLDDSFRVLDESGIDTALSFLKERCDTEKARIRAHYGDAGREALREARDLLRAWRDASAEHRTLDA